MPCICDVDRAERGADMFRSSRGTVRAGEALWPCGHVSPLRGQSALADMPVPLCTAYLGDRCHDRDSSHYCLHSRVCRATRLV